MPSMEEELMHLVNLALDDLYKNDRYLLEVNASERNIVFHFGRYFIKKLEVKDSFNKYNVDYEYNRNVVDAKIYKEVVHENKKHRIFPDIILHERGSNNNILAVELKKYSNKDKRGERKDYLKLKVLTDNNLSYKYKMGLSIKLGKTREEVNIIKFINGKEINQD